MYYNQPEKNNCREKFIPTNRFLFLCCHKNEVADGWGFTICKCRTFSFKCGVLLFSFIFIINGITEYNELKTTYTDSGIFSTSDDDFMIFIKIKLISDIICIIAGIIRIYSVYKNSYWAAIISYYTCALSLISNTVFIFYVTTEIGTFDFWYNVGFLKIFSVCLCFFLNIFG